MKSHIRKMFFVVPFVALLGSSTLQAQDNDLKLLQENTAKDNVVMTWNKTTPESEMNDDVKALAGYGITIKYSNVKRNAKGEITALRMEFSDRKGNKGKLELEGEKPISPIKFFKSGDEIGFGEPQGNEMMWANNDMFGNFSGGDNFMKQFNFDFDNPTIQQFGFSMPEGGEGFSKSKSRIMIKKDNRKPLVIEDGEVVEGADEYSPEEIEEIKKSHRVESFGNGGQNFQFNRESDQFKSLDEMKAEMKRMQEDMQKMYSNGDTNRQMSDEDELAKTKEEMLKAKEEMLKAKEEMEKAKKDLEKAKNSLKVQKI